MTSILCLIGFHSWQQLSPDRRTCYRCDCIEQLEDGCWMQTEGDDQ